MQTTEMTNTLDMERRFKAAVAGGEITTPSARELAELSLRVCELELENSALRGQNEVLLERCAAQAAADAHYLKRPAVDGFPALVAAELARAPRDVAPDESISHEAYAVIKEEFDEYWEIVREQPSIRSAQRLLKEIVQVAAMCQCAAEDLNYLPRAAAASAPVPPSRARAPSRGLEPARTPAPGPPPAGRPVESTCPHCGSLDALTQADGGRLCRTCGQRFLPAPEST